MITTKITGGLGNQMFQYAAGRALSLKNSTELYVDLSALSSFNSEVTHRVYGLDSFDLPIQIATRSILGKYLNHHSLPGYLRSFRKLIKEDHGSDYVEEVGHSFHPELLELTGDKYLSGYWQSEKYFIHEREIILKDFSTRTSVISPQNVAIEQEIQKENSVSIHIRRADYVTNIKTNKYHGICSVDYYKNAISMIENRLEKPTFFVFSDDQQWVVKNIMSKNKIIYVDWNTGKDDHEDIRLMSKCKHNIIANSTFSWWGAWLNQNYDKIVIGPDKWFQDQSVNAGDILPDSWIKI